MLVKDSRETLKMPLFIYMINMVIWYRRIIFLLSPQAKENRLFQS